MDERELMRAREGAKAARQRFDPVPGKKQAGLPLDVVQVDPSMTRNPSSEVAHLSMENPAQF